jgi:uncharacterized protein GlcG (DUF336 family)
VRAQRDRRALSRSGMSGGDQAYDERIAREGSQKVGKGKRHHFNYFSPQYL